MFLEAVKALLKAHKAVLSLACLFMCWSFDTNVDLSIKCWRNYQDGYMAREAAEDEHSFFSEMLLLYWPLK